MVEIHFDTTLYVKKIKVFNQKAILTDNQFHRPVWGWESKELRYMYPDNISFLSNRYKSKVSVFFFNSWKTKQTLLLPSPLSSCGHLKRYQCQAVILFIDYLLGRYLPSYYRLKKKQWHTKIRQRSRYLKN